MTITQPFLIHTPLATPSARTHAHALRRFGDQTWRETVFGTANVTAVAYGVVKPSYTAAGAALNYQPLLEMNALHTNIRTFKKAGEDVSYDPDLCARYGFYRYKVDGAIAICSVRAEVYFVFLR